MLSYSKVEGKRYILQSLTGLNPQEFEELLKSFELAWQEYVEQEYKSKPRARRYGGGRKAELNSSADKLLFILVYYRLYPTQGVQGFLFGIGQSQAWEWIHKLSRLLNQALGYEKQLPEREPANLATVLKQCPSLEFLMDGTERPINRPKDNERQQDYYSGKKKRHTVKNIVVSERKGKIIFMSDTYSGRVHDKGIVDGEEYEFPEDSTLWQDGGFQGFAPPNVKVRQPKKKPPNQPLSDADKQQNREISSERVEIEHQIGGIKRCNIVVHNFRNRTSYFVDDVMETACGLHNFRLTHRQRKAA
jgi:DDE superfamily endonuclease/Helix-turn-helix of DDE superfamily endonuclease